MKPSTITLALASIMTAVAYDELLVDFQSNVSHAIYNIRLDVVTVENNFLDLKPKPNDELLARGQALFSEYRTLAYAADSKLIEIIDWSYEYQNEIEQ